MELKVEHKRVDELFGKNSNFEFKIPRYQRVYTWGKWECEKLFDDLLENEPEYFLGSLVCISDSRGFSEEKSVIVIDGQQRLTTLSLLFAAIHQVVKTETEELTRNNRPFDEIHPFQSLLDQLKIFLTFNESPRLTLQEQNFNNDDYKAVLQIAGIFDSAGDNQPNAGNRKIFRCYYQFHKRIKQILSDDATSSPYHTFFDSINNRGDKRPTKIQILTQITTLVERANLVAISVPNYVNAFVLFEALNYRGTPLTPVDLLKNKILAELEESSEKSIDIHYNRWVKLQSDLGDDYHTQERFFRQYGNAFGAELDSSFTGPVTRSNLIKFYENIIKRDANRFFKDIVQSGQEYAKIIDPELNHNQNLASSLHALRRIQGAPSYILVLYLCARKNHLDLTDDNICEVVNSLVNFFVRRNLTDIPPTRDLIRFFIKMVNNIKDKSPQSIIEHVHDELLSKSCTKIDFERKLRGPIYLENVDVTRFILCTIEDRRFNKEWKPDLWERVSKKYAWTIEHIFPQGENIPDHWVDMIAGGDKNQAKQIQEEFVHTLGNLTLTAYNPDLSNYSFEIKRDRQDNQGNYIGYRNRLHLNQNLANIDTWTVQHIKARTMELVKKTLDLFWDGQDQ